MTRRGTNDSTGNLGGGVLILVKNNLTYSSLPTQHLSSLDCSSDYSAITVKVKGASPIHLFNLYVPPIRSSFSDFFPKAFSSFFLPSSPTTYIFDNFNCHYSLWDSYSPEDQLGKDLFDWFLSSDFLSLNNPDHHNLLHRAIGTGNWKPLETALPLISLWFLPPWPTNVHDRPFRISAQITLPHILINSISRSPSFNHNKAHWNIYLSYIDTHCPPLFRFTTFLFLKPPISLPNSSKMLPLFPFFSAASIALLKPGGLLKSQTPSRNAERHSQGQTILTRTARTTLLS